MVGLWPVALREDLRAALVEEHLHKIEIWTARHGVAIADWPATPVDPFFNVNTPGGRSRGRAHCGAASATPIWPPGPLIAHTDALRRVSLSHPLSHASRSRRASRCMGRPEPGERTMKSFIVACIAAAVIAVGAVVVLNGMQQPVGTAYTTTGVRI